MKYNHLKLSQNLTKKSQNQNYFGSAIYNTNITLIETSQLMHSLKLNDLTIDNKDT